MLACLEKLYKDLKCVTSNLHDRLICMWQLRVDSIYIYKTNRPLLSHRAAMRISNIILHDLNSWEKKTLSKFEVVLLFHIGSLSGVKAAVQQLWEADKWRKQDSRSCSLVPRVTENGRCATSLVPAPGVPSTPHVVHKTNTSYTHSWPLSVHVPSCQSEALLRRKVLSSQRAGPWRLKKGTAGSGGHS